MTNKERDSIAQLALAEGVNESVFEKYSDDQLRERVEKLFGEE